MRIGSSVIGVSLSIDILIMYAFSPFVCAQYCCTDLADQNASTSYLFQESPARANGPVGYQNDVQTAPFINDHSLPLSGHKNSNEVFDLCHVTSRSVLQVDFV